MAPAESLVSPSSPPSGKRRQVIFFAAAIALILAAVLRSSLATRLDGFTMDEAYHITAGVSYWRTGDYRLNPEHPPLVKLWVGRRFQAKDSACLSSVPCKTRPTSARLLTRRFFSKTIPTAFRGAPAWRR
jgi:hypothetical protein